MRKCIAIISFAAFSFLAADSFSQLQVTASTNAAMLAQTLAGAGVTISGATMNCPSTANDAAGTFVGTSSNIGIANGVLLTSGSVTNAIGPNIQSSITTANMVTYNDPDLMAIDPQATFDVCLLEFNAVPSCSTLAFTFAFGSDEYPEFVNSIFNDAFGIFVTGPNPSGPAYTGYNMALIPASTTPVAINNVNNGTICPTSGPCVNCTYYVDNCTGTSVEYDGFTKPITVTLNVSPCASYHFKLGIADAGDMAYDSGVFFAMQSLACNPPPIILTTTVTPAGCNGPGSAIVTATGGTAPYTYSWSTTPPQTTPNATGLAAGTYTVNVIDATGCFSNSATVTITTVGGFSVTSTQTNVTCFGNNNGSATATPAGGSAPYTYGWSTNPVQTNATLAGVPAGNYTCTVTDGSGCVSTVTLTLTQPAAVTGTITASTNVSCFGGSNGSATASGGGGTGTITYGWNSAPAQTTPTASGLAAGTYIVTIKDANNCTTTQSVTITQPTGMNLTSSTTAASCGVKDGTASVSATGGASPYTWLWLTNPVQTTPTASNLNAGTYTLIITDANGCTQMQSVTVGGGLPPIADFTFTPDAVSMLDPMVVFHDLSTGSPSIWVWDFDDSGSGANDSSSLQNPNHTFSDTGVYCPMLIISDPSGICRDTIIKCLKVEAPYTFYIPNSFTPNSDGWNELFYGVGTYIKDFDMMLFDRWGNKIWSCHTAGDPQKDSKCFWDGTAQSGKSNQLVQEDVYVWKVEILDLYNKKHKYVGRVTVVR